MESPTSEKGSYYEYERNPKDIKSAIRQCNPGFPEEYNFNNPPLNFETSLSLVNFGIEQIIR